MASIVEPYAGGRIRGLARIFLRLLCLGALLFTAMALASGSVRLAFTEMISRKVALFWPPTYAFVGDSFTADCALSWKFSYLPFTAVSLARGGADLRAIALQTAAAVALRTKFLAIAGGVNDLMDQAPTTRVADDFKILLANVPADQHAIVTLIPYLSDQSKTPGIAAANKAIENLASLRGLPIVDINTAISANGVRKPEMTSDGIHFSERACSIWADMLRAKLDGQK
jgi:hypothetical protein